MSFSIGLVGLPNVGKSTLFSAMTQKQVAAENYPFCTIDPNVGVVPVPDERLEKLSRMSQSKRIVPTVIEFVDIAGLVSGAHKGEGLGNQFLSHIREVAAVAHVVRYFSDPDVIHVAGKVDPLSDIETIALELAMADLATVTKRKESLMKKVRGGDKEAKILSDALGRILQALELGKPARSVVLAEEEVTLVAQLQLLTSKPMLYIVNVDEGTRRSDVPAELAAVDPVVICAKLEAEISGLPEAEVKEYLKASGIEMTGLDQFIRASYQLLGLITFLTTGEKETRAWTVSAGTKAQVAAGVIHTDFIKGFVRAEVIPWQDLLACGSWSLARDSGKLRVEGKDYVIQDGDVVEFKIASV